MSNITSPAAIIAPAPVAAPTIIEQWRSTTTHSPAAHCAYALARMLHAQTNLELEKTTDQEDFDATMRKLVRTFSPVRKPSKLNNGFKQFGALYSALDAVRNGRLGGLELPDGLVGALRICADACFKEARSIGNDGLLAYAAPVVIREKKPYRGR